MSNKLHASQIDTGNEPGKIPVFNSDGTLTLSRDPISPLDAVTKRYVDSLNLTPNVTPVTIQDDSKWKQYVDTCIASVKQSIPAVSNIITNDQLLNIQAILHTNYIELKQDIAKVTAIATLSTPAQPDFSGIQVQLDSIQKQLDQLSEIVEAPTLSLAEHIAQAKYNVDGACAGIFKNDWIYKEKFDQAVDYKTGAVTDLASVPLIQIDVDFYELSADDAVDQIITQRTKYLSALTQIEKLRLVTKKNIDSATDIDYLKAIYDNFILELNKWQILI